MDDLTDHGTASSAFPRSREVRLSEEIAKLKARALRYGLPETARALNRALATVEPAHRDGKARGSGEAV